MKLKLLNDEYSVCRLDVSQLKDLQGKASSLFSAAGEFLTISVTAEELSVVCRDPSLVPAQKVESGWRCFRLQGPIPFTMTGVLKSILEPLARAEIGIFAISTFDTDYVLVKKESLEKAKQALQTSGFTLS